MPAPVRKIQSDLGLALFANSFDKLVGFVLVLVIARALSQEDVGALFYTTALAGFVALFTNLGSGGYLTRAIAEEPDQALDHLSTVLSVRVVLLLLFLAALNLFMLAWRPELLATTVLVSVYVALDELAYTVGSLFLGLRKIAYRVAAGVVSKAALILLVLWVLRAQPALSSVLYAYIAAYALQLLLLMLAGRRLVGPVRWQWDRARALALLRETWPFVALAALSLLHAKVDTFMLGALQTLAVVAIYEAAYKFLEVSRFLIRPLQQIYFPIYATMGRQRRWRALRRQSTLAVGLALLAGLAAIAAVMLLGDWLITFLFGDSYAASIPVIKLLFWSAPAVFVGFISQYLAIALHLERQVLRLLLAAVLLNVTLNALAIPRWGVMGAAATTVVSETLVAAVLFLLCWATLRQRIAGGVAPAGPVGTAPRPALEAKE